MPYDLYAIANSDWPAGTSGGGFGPTAARNTVFVVSGQTGTVTTQPTWATETVKSPGVYTEFVGLTATGGNITISAQTTVATYAGNYETDVNGFQLVPLVYPVNMANSNIVATANSALNPARAKSLLWAR